jgi:hypothetical protein
MRNRIWTGTFTAIVGFATAAIIAQTATPPQSSTSSAERKITITGCLKEAPSSSAASTATGAAGAAGATTGTAGTTGTTGTTGAVGTTGATADPAAATPQFVLTDAVPSPADASASPSTTEATPAGAASAPAAKTYRLIANPSALSPHVGKKLELTGTLEDQDTTPRTTESSKAPEGERAALRVLSGKLVAESCSQQ